MNKIAKRITQSLSQPISVNGNQYIISPKISFSTDFTGFEEILNGTNKEGQSFENHKK